MASLRSLAICAAAAAAVAALLRGVAFAVAPSGKAPPRALLRGRQAAAGGEGHFSGFALSGTMAATVAAAAVASLATQRGRSAQELTASLAGRHQRARCRLQGLAVGPDELQTTVAAGGAVAAFAAATGLLLSSDSSSTSVDDKKVVKEYFNTEGFERWSKIYGDTDDVNPVQKDIRVGHAQTVDKILGWLDTSTINGKTVCDAGCGTGSLSIPLASRGAAVSGSDISSAMVQEAEARAKASLSSNQVPKFETRDLEALEGEFDCVCCVDVLIHYPPERLDAMVGRLARLSKERLILSFAPKTWYYVALKRLGELFPGKSKTTRAYLHEEEVVEAALQKAGFQVTRREMTSTNFYFSRLLEAKPVA